MFFSGWRPSLYDPRDHVYSSPAHLLVSLPASVDLSVSMPAPFDPPWDQGDIGSCGPHSACADLVFAALRQQKLPTCPMPSRLFVYYTTRQVMGTTDQDSGVDNRSMMKALARYGWCDESLWPYSVSFFTRQPPADCYRQAEGRKISQYLNVPQTLDQMRGCLAAGDPFIFGFAVYQSMLTKEVESTGIVPMPTRNDTPVGGHDVLMVGYDDARQRFKFRNSWSPQWGDHGHGYIPYAYATNRQLAGDFWTVRTAALPVPTPPVPVPPPAPGPGPAGKITVILSVDPVTGETQVVSSKPASLDVVPLVARCGRGPKVSNLEGV